MANNNASEEPAGGSWVLVVLAWLPVTVTASLGDLADGQEGRGALPMNPGPTGQELAAAISIRATDCTL